jgi:hypothetical protein
MESLEDLIFRAGGILQEAKKKGKDQMQVHKEPED